MAGDVERHPGPVAPPQGGYAPRGELNLLGGFAQATSLRMRRCLDLFASWCKTEAKMSLETVLQQAETTNLALRGYGLALFREGKPRYLLVYAITAVQQLKPEFRRLLSGAWQVDFKWQIEEPGQCRAVLSAPVLRAILCLGLLWKWDFFVGAVALGFGGMLHPNEFLALRRRDLVFPQDSMTWDSHSLYIFIRNPKTARFARRQHVRVDDRSLVELAFCIFGCLRLSFQPPRRSSAASGMQFWTSLKYLEGNVTEAPHLARFEVQVLLMSTRKVRISIVSSGEADGAGCVLWNIISRKLQPSFSFSTSPLEQGRRFLC